MDLIKLSRAKRFISRDLIEVNEKYYYLWMCEFQKWLREVHDLHISIDFHRNYGYNLDKAYYYKVSNGDLDYNFQTNDYNIYQITFEDWINDEANKSYEEALEASLLIALNLIK